MKGRRLTTEVLCAVVAQVERVWIQSLCQTLGFAAILILHYQLSSEVEFLQAAGI